jgi:magnesium-protoporphyrin O-methyltransferase
MAWKNLRSYRKNGPDKSTAKLLDVIKTLSKDSLSNQTLLDIGGGIGVIGMELIANGLKSAVIVDISSVYSQTVQDEITDRGIEDQIRFITADAVLGQEKLEEASIVTLDKSICCYPDYKSLIGASLIKAKDLYGIIIPRNKWWVKSINWIGNLFRKIRGMSFRTYVHPVDEIIDLVSNGGFKLETSETSREWQIMVFSHN